MSTMMSAIKAVGSDNVGFNPFAFKRSFSATVIYSASALYFVKMAMESFWSDYTVYQITDPASITIIMKLTPALSLLRYLSVLAFFLAALARIPLVRKAHYSMRNDHRRLYAVLFAVSTFVALTLDFVVTVAKISLSKEAVAGHPDDIRKVCLYFSQQMLHEEALKALFRLAVNGVLFFALMLPVNSTWFLALWLRPFYVRPEASLLKMSTHLSGLLAVCQANTTSPSSTMVYPTVPSSSFPVGYFAPLHGGQSSNTATPSFYPKV